MKVFLFAISASSVAAFAPNAFGVRRTCNLPIPMASYVIGNIVRIAMDDMCDVEDVVVRTHLYNERNIDERNHVSLVVTVRSICMEYC